jgi:hypothetical protein
MSRTVSLINLQSLLGHLLCPHLQLLSLMNEEEQSLNHNTLEAARTLGALLFILNCQYRKNFGLQFLVADHDRTERPREEL